MKTETLLRTQYWVQLKGAVHGPYPAAFLRRIRGFTLNTPARGGPQEPWAPAYQVVDLGAYFTVPAKAFPPPSVDTTPFLDTFFHGGAAARSSAKKLSRLAGFLTGFAAACVITTLKIVPMPELQADARRAQQPIAIFVQHPKKVITVVRDGATTVIRGAIRSFQKRTRLLRETSL